MRKSVTARWTAGVLAAALLSWGGIAHAQPGQQGQQGQQGQYSPPPPSQNQQQTEVSDEQLNQFAEAVGAVRSVQEEYSEAIQSTQDTDEAQSLREEAQQNMVEAVEDAGLSVSEYNLISQQIQNNPELARRLDEMR